MLVLGRKRCARGGARCQGFGTNSGPVTLKLPDKNLGDPRGWNSMKPPKRPEPHDKIDLITSFLQEAEHHLQDLFPRAADHCEFPSP